MKERACQSRELTIKSRDAGKSRHNCQHCKGARGEESNHDADGLTSRMRRMLMRRSRMRKSECEEGRTEQRGLVVVGFLGFE